MGAAPVRGSRDFAHIGHALACRAVLSDLRSAAFTRFPHGSVVKGAPDNAGEPGSIPGLGRPPGGGNAVHSRILAWRIPGTEEPGGLQSMGSQKSQTRLRSSTTTLPTGHVPKPRLIFTCDPSSCGPGAAEGPPGAGPLRTGPRTVFPSTHRAQDSTEHS